jgi:hypothetical protein
VAAARVIRRQHIKLPTSFPGPRQVKVGFPAGMVDSPVINRAIWNHYGTSRGIPARPFLTNAIRNNRSAYLAAMKTSGAKILRGETDLETVMRKLGVKAQGDIQQEITNLRDPPNTVATIEAKGSSNPLIDTGEMRSKVTWQVKR